MIIYFSLNLTALESPERAHLIALYCCPTMIVKSSITSSISGLHDLRNLPEQTYICSTPMTELRYLV
jgi:hypothetical protein